MGNSLETQTQNSRLEKSPRRHPHYGRAPGHQVLLQRPLRQFSVSVLSSEFLGLWFWARNLDSPELHAKKQMILYSSCAGNKKGKADEASPLLSASLSRLAEEARSARGGQIASASDCKRPQRK